MYLFSFCFPETLMINVHICVSVIEFPIYDLDLFFASWPSKIHPANIENKSKCLDHLSNNHMEYLLNLYCGDAIPVSMKHIIWCYSWKFTSFKVIMSTKFSVGPFRGSFDFFMERFQPRFVTNYTYLLWIVSCGLDAQQENLLCL